MYKVFIVEDEEILRKGMIKNINWNEIEYELVGDAPDGEIALPLIREVKPDIVITDIKMPFMDGLKLSRILKSEFPNIKIMVLTGYDEFDFAREALTIGADEYILKPFSATKVKEVLDNISNKINEEKRKKIWEYEKLSLGSNLIDAIEEIRVSNISLSSLYNEKIEDFFKLGTLNEIDNFIERYISNLRNTSNYSCVYAYYSYINTHMIAANFIKKINCDVKEVLPEISVVERKCLDLNSIDSLSVPLSKLFKQIINFRDSHKENKYQTIIEKSKQIIKERYDDCNLSLNVVADYVEMSPNHFSSIFHNETGETFINYLIHYRIKKAQEMLKSSSKKIYEVAESVGYTDSHYFSSIFRKITGQTPTEYRTT